MMVLITYDVNTETPQGRKRLRKVAKECTNYGHRVQNSVFECVMDSAKCVEVKNKLSSIINLETDSIDFIISETNTKPRWSTWVLTKPLMLRGCLCFSAKHK